MLQGASEGADALLIMPAPDMAAGGGNLGRAKLRFKRSALPNGLQIGLNVERPFSIFNRPGARPGLNMVSFEE
jgi:hypothetical protein